MGKTSSTFPLNRLRSWISPRLRDLASQGCTVGAPEGQEMFELIQHRVLSPTRELSESHKIGYLDGKNMENWGI